MLIPQSNRAYLRASATPGNCCHPGLFHSNHHQQECKHPLRGCLRQVAGDRAPSGLNGASPFGDGAF